MATTYRTTMASSHRDGDTINKVCLRMGCPRTNKVFQYVIRISLGKAHFQTSRDSPNLASQLASQQQLAATALSSSKAHALLGFSGDLIDNALHDEVSLCRALLLGLG